MMMYSSFQPPGLGFPCFQIIKLFKSISLAWKLPKEKFVELELPKKGQKILDAIMYIYILALKHLFNRPLPTLFLGILALNLERILESLVYQQIQDTCNCKMWVWELYIISLSYAMPSKKNCCRNTELIKKKMLMCPKNCKLVKNQPTLIFVLS